ncbi:P8 family protein [Lactobacillus kitasatonis]|uniref:P8 family protein n=1 Tax=Lactobacillus kitasatonis TaxID=237446 RepID=UPI003F66A874
MDDKDREMDQAFDWAKDNHMPIRDAIWDYEMEANGHDTMKTEKAVEWILKASDDEVKDYCEKNLKK